MLALLVVAIFFAGIGFGYALAFPVAYRAAYYDMIDRIQNNIEAQAALYKTMIQLDGGALLLTLVRKKGE